MKNVISKYSKINRKNSSCAIINFGPICLIKHAFDFSRNSVENRWLNNVFSVDYFRIFAACFPLIIRILTIDKPWLTSLNDFIVPRTKRNSRQLQLYLMASSPVSPENRFFSEQFWDYIWNFLKCGCRTASSCFFITFYLFGHKALNFIFD